MNQKVFKTLEYNKILQMLSGFAACDETKKRCLALEPITQSGRLGEWLKPPVC